MRGRSGMGRMRFSRQGIREDGTKFTKPPQATRKRRSRRRRTGGRSK